MVNEFLKAKDEKHSKEDPKILDPLSDIFDIRNWNLNTFNPRNNLNIQSHDEDSAFKIE